MGGVALFSAAPPFGDIFTTYNKVLHDATMRVVMHPTCTYVYSSHFSSGTMKLVKIGVRFDYPMRQKGVSFAVQIPPPFDLHHLTRWPVF